MEFEPVKARQTKNEATTMGDWWSIQFFSSNNRVNFIEEHTSLKFMMHDELIDHRVLHWSQNRSWCVLFSPEVDRLTAWAHKDWVDKILQRNLSTAQMFVVHSGRISPMGQCTVCLKLRDLERSTSQQYPINWHFKDPRKCCWFLKPMRVMLVSYPINPI